ncbi:Cpl-7 lysozyme C-terminal domain [Actinomyces bovis]|uniref:Cpl-7 lysozyme C-terminal domain n=1 Tax=Actinomyces bovis TaxID=1658 RepID=A0ABY1VNP8_9ACTO|nr:hypothetical protein [Actinomyces bovis]SPT52693.1 Cpl-7 lysozyme C-terminal domain [Actinomyces bovis]VEG54630.1 Cpl-7 lysozyme C-terminal domain [Actinomyces israelii]
MVSEDPIADTVAAAASNVPAAAEATAPQAPAVIPMEALIPQPAAAVEETVPSAPATDGAPVVEEAAPAETPDIEALAHAVIRGDYGNGEDRRAALGDLYDQVQARVDEILS